MTVGCAFVFHRRLVGRVDLQRIVAAAAQIAQICRPTECSTSFSSSRILAEEVLADVGAGLDRVFLIFAVDYFVHAADEQAVSILVEQRIPVASPR